MNCMTIICSILPKNSFKKIYYSGTFIKNLKSCTDVRQSIGFEFTPRSENYFCNVRSHWKRILRKLSKQGGSRSSAKRNSKSKLLLSSMAFFVPNVRLYTSASSLDNKLESSAKKPEAKLDYRQRNWFLRIINFIYEFIRVIIRSLRLGLTFVPVILLYPVTYLGVGAQEFWWKLLLSAIEISGPIFIKFGQWASTRRDLFPEVCCHHFSRLQRRTKPHSFYYTKLILQKTFGKNWRKIFVKFDNNKEPIGSGCVAQVYKVWICPDEAENKDIIEEILQEDEEEKILHLADGLEILGFRNLFKSRKAESKEEEEAVAEYNRKRNLRIEARRELEILSFSNSQMRSDSGDVSGTIENNQNNSSLQNEFLDHTNDSTDMKELEEESLVEHTLNEDWQDGAENLEKSLSLIQNDPEDFGGLVPVAVKVLHPNIYRVFRRDLTILRCGAAFISTIYPPLRWLSLEQCIEEFSRVMSDQLDMRVEANNMEQFSQYFTNVDCIRFPRPLRPFVNRMVLTETFEDGEPLGNFIVDQKCDSVKKNLAKIVADSLMKMIFVDNFVHADLHPGNMIVQNYNPSSESPNGDGNQVKLMMIDVGSDIFIMDVQPDPKPLRVCMLDCGIVASLKENDLGNLKGVLTQVCLGDGAAVADLFLINSEHECREPELFRQDMAHLVESARKNSVTLGQVDVGILLQEVLSLLLRHHVRLESAFSSVVLAVFVVEGIGRSLDPDMDILERARPVLIKETKRSFWPFRRNK